MIDIEKLKALAALPGDIGRNELAFWMAENANEIIRELEEARKDAETMPENCVHVQLDKNGFRVVGIRCKDEAQLKDLKELGQYLVRGY